MDSATVSVITAGGDQIIRQVDMVHALHFLLDDRALVQIAGDVMGGGADQLHATFVSLVIGLGAFENRGGRSGEC